MTTSKDERIIEATKAEITAARTGAEYEKRPVSQGLALHRAMMSMACNEGFEGMLGQVVNSWDELTDHAIERLRHEITCLSDFRRQYPK